MPAKLAPCQRGTTWPQTGPQEAPLSMHLEVKAVNQENYKSGLGWITDLQPNPLCVTFKKKIDLFIWGVGERQREESQADFTRSMEPDGGLIS